MLHLEEMLITINGYCRMISLTLYHKRLLISVLIFIAFILPTHAANVTVTGTVSDRGGAPVMNARVSFFLNSREFRVSTGTDGRYSVMITGSYSDVAGEFSGLQIF